MELTFKLVKGHKHDHGKFEIENLQVLDVDPDLRENVTWDNIILYLDGKLYENDIETFAMGNLDAEDIFRQCLNAYLRNDTSDYESFGDEWSIFKKCEVLKEYKDNLLIKMPIYEYDGLHIYELDLATPYNRYYYESCGNGFLCLDSNGGLVTDMECWYEQGIIEDLCAIIKGELKCLYRGENVNLMIKEYGGEEAFLEENDN